MDVTAPANLTDNLPGRELRSAGFVHSAWWFEQTTPAHTFRTVIATMDKAERFVFIVARDFFDDGLAGEIITFFRNTQGNQTIPEVGRVISGFRHPQYSFDELLILGPQAHCYFDHDGNLANQCVQAIPAFHGEFSGSETAEVIELLRRQNVKSLDWRRSASPQVWLYLPDARLGRKRGLTNERHTLEQIQKLQSGENHYLEIENYRGDVCTVSRLAGDILVTGPGASLRLKMNVADIDDWLHQFLIIGPAIVHQASPIPPLSGEQVLRVFLYDSQRGREIKSEEAMAMSLPSALDEFDRLPNVVGCFIGFRRSDGQVFQFAWNADGSLGADIPLPTRHGSLQRTDSWQELRPLIELFAQGEAVERLPGLRFRGW